jgi:hypothetical protein
MINFDNGINDPEDLKTKKAVRIIVATIKAMGELATELIRKGIDGQMVYDMVYELIIDRTGSAKKAKAFASLMTHEISMNMFNVPVLSKSETDRILDILFSDEE